MKKPCFFEGCNYRGLPDNLRIHETRHQSEAKSAEIRRINLEVKLIEEQEAEAGGTPGRSKRRAATKANERLSEVVAILKSKMDADDSGAEDIEGGDDDGDDDAFVPSNEIDTEGKFEVKKSADGVRTFHCKICNLVETRKEDMASHLVSEHADDLEGDDDYNGDDDVSDEDDGAGFGEDEDDSSLCEEDTGGGGESLRRRTTTAGARSNRPCILEPAPAFVDVESEFRAANFDRNKFEDFVTSASDWVKVEDPEIFLPSQTTSAKFASASSKQPSTNGDNQQNMTRFSATSSSQCTFMYAGGPIYAAGWCPNSDPSATERFLALSTWDSENDQHSGLIQIWAHDSDSKNTEYKFGIAHPGGSVRSLQWCPSGNQSEGAPGSQLSRIGNLAVASTDGAVRIYSVCHPCHLEAAAVYNVRSVRTLNLGNGGKVPECLKVCWYRGRGHRVIAASFSNGSVALWDLQQPEDSLQRDGDVLFPYTTINAHFSSVTGLDLGDKSCVGDTEFPAKLATGSSDRFCHIWDLDSRTSTTLPSQSIKKGHVSDVSFVKHSPGGGHAAISFDDVFLQSHTQTVVFESGDDGCVKTHPIVAQNSAVLSHSYNPWLSVLVLGTAGGEVLAYIAPPIGKALEHDKDSNRRRTLIYR
jgi:WD40 repeat protein